MIHRPIRSDEEETARRMEAAGLRDALVSLRAKPWSADVEDELRYTLERIHDIEIALLERWSLRGRGSHECEFRVMYSTGYLEVHSVTEECKRCGKRNERAPTEQEQKEAQERAADQDRKGIHSLWHEIKDKLDKCENIDDELSTMEMYAEFNSEVHNVRVDDSYHSSSDLFFIEHFDSEKGKYWGTTVLYYPQCSGEGRAEFFLYPNHSKNLFHTVGNLLKKQQLYPYDEFDLDDEEDVFLNMLTRHEIDHQWVSYGRDARKGRSRVDVGPLSFCFDENGDLTKVIPKEPA